MREHQFVWRVGAAVAVVLAVVATTAAHVVWRLPTLATVAIGVCNVVLGVYAAATVSARLAHEPAAT